MYLQNNLIALIPAVVESTGIIPAQACESIPEDSNVLQTIQSLGLSVTSHEGESKDTVTNIFYITGNLFYKKFHK
jgi:hypothetical protein